MPRYAQYIRWVYESLVAVYWALLLVSKEAMKEGSTLLDITEVPFRYLDRVLGSWLHWTIFSDDVYRLQFGSLWLVAFAILVCLRALGQIARIRTLVCLVAGSMTVAGPLYCRFFMHPDWYLTTATWLWLEVAVLVACVVLYLYRRWPMNTALGIVIAVFHFGFWGWVVWGQAALHDHLWHLAVYMLLPLCATLLWGLYVKLLARPRPPITTPVLQ